MQVSCVYSLCLMPRREATQSGFNPKCAFNQSGHQGIPPAPPLSTLERPHVQGVVVKMGCTCASPQLRLQLMNYAVSMLITL